MASNDSISAYYDGWVKKMIGSTYVDVNGDTQDTVQTKALKAVKEQFDTYGFDNTTLGQILSEMAIQIAIAFNKDAINASVSAVQEDTKVSLATAEIALSTKQLDVADSGIAVNTADIAVKTKQLDVLTAEIANKTKQGLLIDRQKRGFDDNIFIKDVEFQANLASFAVNSGSATAQTTIDALTTKMTNSLNRADAYTGAA